MVSLRPILYEYWLHELNVGWVVVVFSGINVG